MVGPGLQPRQTGHPCIASSLSSLGVATCGLLAATGFPAPAARPGPQVVRRPHDRPRPAERLDVHHLRAAGRAGLLLCDPRRRRRRPGPQGPDRHGAHVRAHGLQGHARRRHDRLREGEARARGDGSGLSGAAARARRAPARRKSDREAHQGLRGRPDERAAVRETERLRRADLARGRRRASTPAPARTPRSTTTTCPRTSSSSSPISSPSASGGRSSASSTRSATSSSRNGACGPRASPSAG